MLYNSYSTQTLALFFILILDGLKSNIFKFNEKFNTECERVKRYVKILNVVKNKYSILKMNYY